MGVEHGEKCAQPRRRASTDCSLPMLIALATQNLSFPDRLNGSAGALPRIELRKENWSRESFWYFLPNPSPLKLDTSPVVPPHGLPFWWP